MKNFLFIMLLLTFGYTQSWSNNYIYEQYDNSVVRVECYRNDKLYSSGTGFIVKDNGTIVTNFHIIEGADKINIITIDETVIEVNHYYVINKPKDYAILKASGSNMPSVILGNSNNINIGSDIMVIGHPLGLSFTLTTGIISQIGANQDNEYILITAPLLPGSSGSPLFNSRGEVIGVINEGLKGEDFNFAIPINCIVEELKNLSLEYKKLDPLVIAKPPKEPFNWRQYLKPDPLLTDSLWRQYLPEDDPLYIPKQNK